MKTETKGLTLEIKDADKGVIRTVFAETGVKDLDGDWTLPGAFGEQEVALSPYGHTTLRRGDPPIGKGTISEVGSKAVGEFQVFMEIPRAKEQFDVVKAMGPLQQWSYGFDILETGEVTKELRDIGVFRVLKKVKVHEVSPVLVGAGTGTRTLAAKDKGQGEAGPNVRRVVCDCGRVLGESPDSLVFVGKVKELADVTIKGPRDVRHCKSCSRFVVYVPANLLTKGAA